MDELHLHDLMQSYGDNMEEMIEIKLTVYELILLNNRCGLEVKKQEDMMKYAPSEHRKKEMNAFKEIKRKLFDAY